MTGFLRDFAAKRPEGLVGPDLPGPEHPDENPHPRWPIEPLCCTFHYPVDRPAYDEAPAVELAERMRAALTRHDPLPGDRVRWHDGSFGVVHLVAASWLDPGEAVVYRDEAQAHPGAPTWWVEAGSLVAEAPDEAGAVLFVYRGSLR